jgi:alkanesulfonate monooxygenase SsuD/methylene tetrahydromethanopterin reductase-like flavin-dependent oxidoreductase (luciferase family)
MKFGYLSLSDNTYDNNHRTPAQLIADIVEEAIYADELGMHSIWLGEHHFNSLGVVSCPDLLLAKIAGRTKHARLAPGICILPLHHPIQVAERWASLDVLSNGRVDFAAGRGYDERGYAPYAIPFEDNQAIFAEGLKALHKLWNDDKPASHHGKYYSFEKIKITPQPIQKSIPIYVASFSRPTIDMAARLGCGLVVAPFAAAMSFGGLKQVASIYRESCAKHGAKPGRLVCSYFIHFADNPVQENQQRQRQIRYFKECLLRAFPADPENAPPSYRYFIEIVDRLQRVRAEDLSENSVLLGSPQRIIESLKKIEAAGFDEVLLYFSMGLKPHAQVKEEMARFMSEVAPQFV